MVSTIKTSPFVKTYTLEEFWQLPEPPDGSKLELIAGVLYMTPPPEYTHDNVVKRLLRLLTLRMAAIASRAGLHGLKLSNDFHTTIFN